MKSGKKVNVIISVILAVTLVFPFVLALAEDPDPHANEIMVVNGEVTVYDPDLQEPSDNAELTESKKLEGDLSVETDHTENNHALCVFANNEDSAFTVDGSVELNLEDTEGNGIEATAVEAVAHDGLAAQATVDGNVTASVTSAGKAQVTAVDVFGNSGDVTVHVTGNVTADANTSTEAGYIEAVGVSTENASPSSAVEVAVDGKITSNVTGINVDNRGGSTVIKAHDIEAGRTAVNVDSYSGLVDVQTGAIEAVNEGITVNGWDDGDEQTRSEIKVAVGGDISVGGEGADEVNGVLIEADDKDTTVQFSVEGKIDVGSEKGSADGVYIWAEDGASVNGDVTGGLTVKGEEYASGINVYGYHSTVDLTVGDQVAVSGSQYAAGIIAVTNGTDSSVTIKVNNGGISAESENTAGIGTENYDGLICINVKGDVVSSDTGISMKDEVPEDEPVNYDGEITPGDGDECVDAEKGIWVQVIDGKKVYYSVDSETGEIDRAWTLEPEYERKGGATQVAVVGDVVAGDTAAEVELTEAESTMELTVDGTMEGKKHAIVLSEETIAENVTMTVWEVKPNDQGALVERCEVTEDKEGKETKTYTGDREAEKLIQYIIRIEDSSAPYIATSGTTDFEAANGEKYKVAREGDTVLVKLAIPSDKELVGAYWDKAQSEAGRLLYDDATGEYYLEVPRGGGVEISLVLKDAPEPEPEPQPEPQPQPGPDPQPEPEPPRPDNYATLKFFDDADSAPRTVVKAKGQPYKLPTPTREGQTFVGWAEGMIEPTNPNWHEPEEGSLSIIPGGTEYIVMGDRCFVGIWR